jgi:hypothetical protein
MQHHHTIRRSRFEVAATGHWLRLEPASERDPFAGSTILSQWFAFAAGINAETPRLESVWVVIV